MPLDPDFVADCLYGPGAILFDELTADRAEGMVRGRMPTNAELPFTRDQVGESHIHPRHVAGGVLVHATGILGFAHAYYCLDLRAREGWVGFGTHIHHARFRTLATLGEPLSAECRVQQMRRYGGNYFVRYRFAFEQGGKQVYESEQSAVFRNAGA